MLKLSYSELHNLPDSVHTVDDFNVFDADRLRCWLGHNCPNPGGCCMHSKIHVTHNDDGFMMATHEITGKSVTNI